MLYGISASILTEFLFWIVLTLAMRYRPKKHGLSS